MKLKLLTYFIPLILLSVTGYSQNPQKNILFVGNSITYFNDMPGLFRDIANSKGKNVETQTYAVGGAGFVNHVTDLNLYALFRDNVWDAVVLQPGTGESAGASWPVNTTIQRGQILLDSIKKYSPCAKVLLYQIPYGVPSPTTYDTYQSVQTQIRDSITKMADNLHIPFAPAGESARMHYTAQQDLLLHNSYNDIHPNLNGSYLVAATMFATIFQEPVTGTTSYGGVPQPTAEYFHGIADQVVLPNKPQWRINTYDLHANFDYVLNGNSVSFTNTSANYTGLLWDFGDGTTATEENPTHTYSSNGIVTIKLKATLNNCDEIIEKQIDFGVLSATSFAQNNVRLYPNPVQSVLNFETETPSAIKIISALGQEIFRSNEQKNNWQVNVSALQSGIYFIVTESQSVYKFIKF